MPHVRGHLCAMAFDLQRAMLKKQEVESARLDDFAFRLRARTLRLLALALGQGIDPQALAGEVAVAADEAILERLIVRFPYLDPPALHAAFDRCRAEARAQLVAELGDPSPHRLA